MADEQQPPEGTGEPERMVFTLKGEEFECIPWLPGSVLIAHERAMSMEGPGRGVVVLAELDNFLRRALLPTEYVRYRLFADDPGQEIGIQEIGLEVVQLHERYLGRPTPRPSSSPDGPGTTGDTSTDSSPSEDSTSTDSPQETPAAS